MFKRSFSTESISDQLFIDIPLDLTPENTQAMNRLYSKFQRACKIAEGPAKESGVFNRVSLHQKVYYKIRESQHTSTLSAQMACNAIQAVCHAYVSLPKAERKQYKETRFTPMSWPRIPVEKQTIKVMGSYFRIETPGKLKISVPIPEDLQPALVGRVIYKGNLHREGGVWFLQAETRPVVKPGDTRARTPIPDEILSVLVRRALAAGALYFEPPSWHLLAEGETRPEPQGEPQATSASRTSASRKTSARTRKSASPKA